MIKIKCHKGFTLIEVLATILIFSLVVTMLFTSFRAFMSSGRHVRDSLEQSRVSRAFQNRLHTDIQALLLSQPPRYTKPEFNSEPDPFKLKGRFGNIQGKMVSVLQFTSLAHAQVFPGDRDGVAKIVYYVRVNSDGGFDLCRSDLLMPAFDGQRSCSDPVVFENITGFEVTYYDREGESFDHWDSDDKAFRYTFPERVKILVRQGSGGNERMFETTLSLRSSRRSLD